MTNVILFFFCTGRLSLEIPCKRYLHRLCFLFTLNKKPGMKTLFPLLLFFSITAGAQLTGKQLKELKENTAKVESTRLQLESSMNQSLHVMDSINMENFNNQNERNLNAFLKAQKQREQKARQRIYWRMGFGVLMLVVLVAGWVRKKKTV
jgi:hypothetical protein